MHELGIIVHIAKTLDQVAAENELKKIGSVTLDIGEVSGIVPEYLTECWEFYRKKNPLIAECEMKIESLPATVRRPMRRLLTEDSARIVEAMKRIL